MRAVVVSLALFVLAFLALRPALRAQPAPPADSSRAAAAAPAARDPKLPPDEGAAKDQLNASPRHGEYATVPYAGTPIRVWVSYPETRGRAPVVLIVHEIFGLSDWIRGVADQLAKEGYIAVAPDLVSGLGPGGGGTDSARTRDDVVAMVGRLSREETLARLAAVRLWAGGIPAANGKMASLGFCWGGGVSFALAASRPPLDGAVVFYGVTPDSATLAAVSTPVLAHYGGDDARVDATIPAARAGLAQRHVRYDPHVYDGAGHAFLRNQSGRDGANLKATREAWPLTLAFLRQRLR